MVRKTVEPKIDERELMLADLTIDSRLRMRCAVDEEHVDRLAEVIVDGGELPPIDVVAEPGAKVRYWVWDGQHRARAVGRAGRREIRCRVRAGTFRDAMLLAAGANQAHGLPRTAKDRRRAIQTLLDDPQWRKRSDRWLAEVVGCGRQLVGCLRAELDARVTQVADQPPEPAGREGKDGKVYQPRPGKKTRAEPAEPDLPPALARKIRNTAADTPAERAELAKVAARDPELAATVADVIHDCEASSVAEALREGDQAEPEQPEQACDVLRQLLAKTASAWRASCGRAATPALGASVLEAVADEWITEGWSF